MLEVISRLHPAAGQQRIGGADNGGVPKSGSDVELIIVLQKGTVNDADNIAPVVVPVFIYKLRRHTLHLIGKSVFTGNVEALLQRRRYHLTMLLPVFPKIRAARVLAAAGIGNIEYISEFGLVAAGIHKGVALGMLCRELGTDLDHAAAIGDSENDLEMLNAVALPIAMGNASAAVKNLCLRETLTNAQDGVAAAIDRIIAENG